MHTQQSCAHKLHDEGKTGSDEPAQELTPNLF